MTVSERQCLYLQAMGVRLWVARGAQAQPVEQAASGEPHVRGDAGAPGWETLQGQVAACTRCELYRTRTQTVFGVGDRSADCLVIGEAPGADEDRQGEPFVGRAGRLLNEMLWAIGLPREQVYIANMLKCRPPNNRDPRPEEIASCELYLQRQIALLRPRVIIAVGRIAAQSLLNTDQRIGALRGRPWRYADTGIPVVVTYHPAYLLRSPLEKRKAWNDLQQARRLLSGDE